MEQSKKFKIVQYERESVSIDVRYDDENHTIWLTQSEIALVFDTSKRNIGMHVKNILGGKSDFLPNIIELNLNNQKANAYNLDMIEAISQRSKSTSGYEFVKWANSLISNNKHNDLAEISLDEGIKSKIYVIKGVQVMLDFELAELYGYDTKTFNQQVQRNIEKFPSRYMFKLTKTELVELSWSQNVTLNKGRGYNFKYLPYAFTEQGIYMLMTVLKGEFATKQSIMLIDTFKAMKDYIIESNNLLSSSELLKLTNTVNDNTKSISLINSELSKIQEKQNESELKLEKVMDYFNDSSTHKEFTFYKGNRIEADVAYMSIYKQAKSSLIIIDDYIDIKTLQLLKACNKNINLTIITDNKDRNKSNKLNSIMINDFIKDTNINISIIQNLDEFHDRYIIIDYKTNDEMIYHCGPSSKDAGSKTGSIMEAERNLLDHSRIDIVLLHPALVL